MLMEQLTSVKMEKYEALEKVKKFQKEIDALKKQSAAFDASFSSLLQEKEKAEAATLRAQGTIGRGVE